MTAPRATDLSQPIPGYEILEQLGAGGMSSVYKARHKGLDRMVAIKVIRRDQIDPGLALARLTKEARVLARLDHPAIVRSIDFGEIGDFVFFVMELVEGRSCKQVLIDLGRFPLREVLLIGERVALALGHAASHGVIHRDVKPANILLAKDGAVKLTDFGLARATRDRSLTQDGITVGTPQYMSPEQVRSPRRVDLRSDLYSLGATLYHLVTAEPPFRGENVGEILHEVLYASPKPPEQIVPGLPAGFSRVLARLLAKDARRRYQSARELVADLQRVRAAIAGGADDDTVGLSWQESAEPPARSARPWLLAAAALVIAGVAGFALLRDRTERGDPVAEARAREAVLLADLGAALDGRARTPAQVLAELEAMRREGALSNASLVERLDLKRRAEAALEAELDGAAATAREQSRRALQRGDFAGAARAFESAFAARCSEIVPSSISAAMIGGDVDPQASIRVRAAEHARELDELAQRVRSQVHAALLEEQYATGERKDVAVAEGRLADARSIVEGYPERERAACAAATRAALGAAGIVVAADVADDELIRRWPDAARAVLEREPTTSTMQIWKEDLAAAIARLQADLLAAVRTAREMDRVAAEQSEEPIDPAARRAALEATLAPQTATLAQVDAVPAELAPEWRAYEAELASVLERRLAEQQGAALARLLGALEGEPVGLLQILGGRRDVDAAQAALRATEGLAPEDAAAWRDVIEDVGAAFAAAREALARQAGSEVPLRNRGGIAFTGRLLADATNQTFTVGGKPATGLRVEDLALVSLEPLIAPAFESEARRVAVLFLLGETKDHERLDPELERLAADRVIATLRRVRADEKLAAERTREERESGARELRAKLDQALAAEDLDAAKAAWAELQRRGDTAEGRRALAERDEIEKALANLRKTARTRAALAAISRNATERSSEPDGTCRLRYAFDRLEEGADLGLASSSERIEGGYLLFAGGESGRKAREEGPVLRLPLDRRAPASLRVELFAPIDEPRHPHFVGLRLGGASVAFFRPNEAKGAPFDPQLAAWFGPLNDFEAHFFDPAYGEAEPDVKGRLEKVGLFRGTAHVIELRWLPESGSSSAGRLEVWLDGQRVYQRDGAMKTPPESDVIELRSASLLRVHALEFRGRLRE